MMFIEKSVSYPLDMIVLLEHQQIVKPRARYYFLISSFNLWSLNSGTAIRTSAASLTVAQMTAGRIPVS